MSLPTYNLPTRYAESGIDYPHKQNEQQLRCIPKYSIFDNFNYWKSQQLIIGWLEVF